jgi:hypothetical protein
MTVTGLGQGLFIFLLSVACYKSKPEKCGADSLPGVERKYRMRSQFPMVSQSRLVTDTSHRCQRCKRKKIKCSGAVPCQGCTEHSVPCVFEKVEKKITVSETQVKHGTRRANSDGCEDTYGILFLQLLVTSRKHQCGKGVHLPREHLVV